MNKITEDLLKIVSDWKGIPDAAYNIREDTGCAGRRSTENIRIDSKTDKPGIDIHVKPAPAARSSISPPASPTAPWTIWSTTTFISARVPT